MLRMRYVGLQVYVMAIAALLLFSGIGVRAAQAQSSKAAPFPVASVHFEQNVTDGDVEVVFEAKGKDDGLTSLKVRSPDGRMVIFRCEPTVLSPQGHDYAARGIPPDITVDSQVTGERDPVLDAAINAPQP